MNKFIQEARAKLDIANKGRANEVKFNINMIDIICRNSNIALVPYEVEGVTIVAVKDKGTGEIYGLTESGDSCE